MVVCVAAALGASGASAQSQAQPNSAQIFSDGADIVVSTSSFAGGQFMVERRDIDGGTRSPVASEDTIEAKINAFASQLPVEASAGGGIVLNIAAGAHVTVRCVAFWMHFVAGRPASVVGVLVAWWAGIYLISPQPGVRFLPGICNNTLTDWTAHVLC